MITFKWLRFIPLAVLVWVGAGCSNSVTPVQPPPAPPQIKLESFSTTQGKDRHLPDDDVFDVIVDAQNRIWIATDQGVAMKDVGADVVTFDDFDGIPNRKCRTLVQRGNKIFVGTWGGGLAYWNGTPTWIKLPIREGTVQGIIDGQVTCMLLDGEFIWLGTVNGLSRYRDNNTIAMNQRWANFSGRLGGALFVTSLAYHQDATFGKEIWVGQKLGGITVLRFSSPDVHFTKTNSAIPELECNGVAFDATTGLFWAAFGTEGVATIDVPNAKWTRLTTVDGLETDLTSSIVVRSNGDVWIGGQRGVTRITAAGALTNFTRGSGLPTERVRKVILDKDDQIWLAFVEGGAAKVLNP